MKLGICKCSFITKFLLFKKECIEEKEYIVSSNSESLDLERYL